jgi:integrase
VVNSSTPILVNSSEPFDIQGPAKPWLATCRRAGIAHLTPHEAGRHGFGTETVVRQRIDVATAAKLGGWRDPTVLLRRYAHALDLEATAEAVFGAKHRRADGTPLTQQKSKSRQRIGKAK